MAVEEELELILTVVLVIVSTTFISLYLIVKHKLHKIREFIDVLDDALYDNAITEQEFRNIWEKFKSVFE